MQLILILALLLYGGRGDAGKMLSQMAPVLESIGGEEVKAALKSAEEINEMLSAINGAGSFTGAEGERENSGKEKDGVSCVSEEFSQNTDNFVSKDKSHSSCEHESSLRERKNESNNCDINIQNFPLYPVANIADKEIIYRLTKYISNQLSAKVK